MNQEGIQARGVLPVHTHITPEQGGIINNDDLFQSCGCRVYLNPGQDIPNVAITKVLFNNTTYDIGGDFDADGVDSEFITPSDGYYSVVGALKLNGLNDQITVRTYVYVDGADAGAVHDASSGGVGVSIKTAIALARLHLTVGQVVDVRIYHNHGVARPLSGGEEVCWLSIFKIGE